MNLVRTSILNGIAVIVKLITFFCINKIFAVYVGPSSYALIGQFQNVLQIVTTLLNGAITNGVIKHTAEYESNKKHQKKLWRTAGMLTFFVAFATSIVIYLLSDYLSKWLLDDIGFSNVFNWFSLNIIFFSFNALLLAIMNGKKDIRRYVKASIIGSVVSLSLTGILTYYLHLNGALIALATYQSLAFIATILVVRNTDYLSVNMLFGSIDWKIALLLGKYFLLAIATAITVPISHILVRTHLINEFGIHAAGLWEALMRLSSANLMLFTSVIAFYLLPKVSGLRDVYQLKKEMMAVLGLILPLFIITAFAIYKYQAIAINILFSQDFLGLGELLGWQLIGDGIKLTSWVVSYVLMGQGIIVGLILCEILAGTCFVLITYVCTSIFGLNGVAISHALTYLMYFTFLCVVLHLTVIKTKKA